MPRLPFVSNATNHVMMDPAEICSSLCDQLTGSVRWVGLVENLKKDHGITHLIEIGARDILSRFAAKYESGVEAIHLHTPESIRNFAARLRGADGVAIPAFGP